MSTKNQQTLEHLKRIRKELEAKGIIGAVPATVKGKKPYTLSRKAINAYKEKYKIELPIPKGTVIIEDV